VKYGRIVADEICRDGLTLGYDLTWRGPSIAQVSRTFLSRAKIPICQADKYLWLGPWKVRIVAEEPTVRGIIVVRTTWQGYLRLLQWRLGETLNITREYTVWVAGIWGLGPNPFRDGCYMVEWRAIYPVDWICRQWERVRKLLERRP
jgi:hypothetical protein